MCGLWGGFHNAVLSQKERDFIDYLATLSTFRGTEGSGVMLANTRKRATKIITEFCTPSELMYGQAKYVNNINGSKRPINLIMGHNRLATNGAKSKGNLHPFENDSIIGAHNGTLFNLIDRNTKTNPEEHSDSYFLFKRVREKGLKETIKNLRGLPSYALTIYDKNSNHLHFLRNKDKPLHLVTTLGNTVFWASESSFINFAIYRGDFSSMFKDKLEVIEAPEDTCLTWDFNTGKWLEAYILKPEPGIVEYSPSYENKSVFQSFCSKRRKENKQVVHHLVPAPTKNVTIETFKQYKGYKGTYYDPNKIKEIMGKGDAWHGRSGSLSDRVYWFSPTDFVYHEDITDPQLKEYFFNDGDLWEGIVVMLPSKAVG